MLETSSHMEYGYSIHWLLLLSNQLITRKADPIIDVNRYQRHGIPIHSQPCDRVMQNSWAASWDARLSRQDARWAVHTNHKITVALLDASWKAKACTCDIGAHPRPPLLHIRQFYWFFSFKALIHQELLWSLLLSALRHDVPLCEYGLPIGQWARYCSWRSM